MWCASQQCTCSQVVYQSDIHFVAWTSLALCFSDLSGPAERQSTLRQAWESPSQSPALRGTPGTTRKVAGKKSLGMSLSVPIQWMYCCMGCSELRITVHVSLLALYEERSSHLLHCSSACVDTSASDRSMELSEIDARLSALQEFMKKSLASRTQTGVS